MKSEKADALVLRFSKKDLEDPIFVLKRIFDAMFRPEGKDKLQHILAEYTLQVVAVAHVRPKWALSAHRMVDEFLAPFLCANATAGENKILSTKGQTISKAFDRGVLAGDFLITYLRLLFHPQKHFEASTRRVLYYLAEDRGLSLSNVESIWSSYRKVSHLWAAYKLHIAYLHEYRFTEETFEWVMFAWPVILMSEPKETLEFLRDFSETYRLLGKETSLPATFGESEPNALLDSATPLELDWVRPANRSVSKEEIMAYVRALLPEFSAKELGILRRYRAPKNN